jgi:pimeloyl-ACP methyl ester carboxylesterase
MLALGILISLNTYSQKRFITIDSAKIWINTIGIENRKKGQPLIVFESGYGIAMYNWDKILTGVSALAPLFTYDRPGIGESEPDNEILTTRIVPDKLMKILNYLKIEPPYVMVGHSLGGLYVRSFAVYYPDLLAGMVLIDPADFTETMENRRLPYLDILRSAGLVDSLFAKWAREEAENIEQGKIARDGILLRLLSKNDFYEIRNSKLPDIPVHILTGGLYDIPPGDRPAEYNDSLLFRSNKKHTMERWTEVVQSVNKGMLFYSGGAGHFVHCDDPELLISSIKIVLNDYELLKEKNGQYKSTPDHRCLDCNCKDSAIQ